MALALGYVMACHRLALVFLLSPHLPLKCKENLHLKISSAEYSCKTYFCIQANSMDPDQTAPREAI